ncbi:hypothetical protein NRY95_07915 [Xanthomonas campestris pv. phormiicola]|nr:hypothetical protein [Xanthomonas campestris pv. phormiicola]UYC17868.1 hypothetical protein NRY95_07915 [Xanthomonas campestris pv. phormiicola]
MKMLSISVAALIALSLAAGGYAWYTGSWPFTHPHSKVRSRPRPPGDHYVTMDKLIVMTHDSAPDAPSQYLAMDLVFAVEDESHATRTKAQLPLLRSIALRTLAGYNAKQIRQMRIDDISLLLRQQYLHTYGSEQDMPFTKIMIARMMIE